MVSTSPGNPKHVDILGSQLDIISPDEVKNWLRRALGDSWDGRCRHIVTLNPEYVMAARRNTAFSQALHSADLSTADGVGVSVAARLLHGAKVERVTGVDLVGWIARASTQFCPLFLLGAAPGVADAAAEHLRIANPGAVISGTWCGGSVDPRHDAESIQRIRSSGARAVAVAYGAPGQIFWIERNRTQLEAVGVQVVVGVGGAFDYLSGVAWRPPELVRRLGLEWLVRLVREPARWKRQLVLPIFALLTIQHAIKLRLIHRS